MEMRDINDEYLLIQIGLRCFGFNTRMVSLFGLRDISGRLIILINTNLRQLLRS